MIAELILELVCDEEYDETYQTSGDTWSYRNFAERFATRVQEIQAKPRKLYFVRSKESRKTFYNPELIKPIVINI